MRRLSKWSARFIGERGFSIGVDDVIPMPRLSDEVAKVTSTSYQACQVRNCSHTLALTLSPLSADVCIPSRWPFYCLLIGMRRALRED